MTQEQNDKAVNISFDNYHDQTEVSIAWNYVPHPEDKTDYTEDPMEVNIAVHFQDKAQVRSFITFLLTSSKSAIEQSLVITSDTTDNDQYQLAFYLLDGSFTGDTMPRVVIETYNSTRFSNETILPQRERLISAFLDCNVWFIDQADNYVKADIENLGTQLQNVM